MIIERLTHSEKQTQRLAQRLGEHLAGSEVIGLVGPLGAGKTCFVRGLAAGLGLEPAAVSSPTFILCQEYGPSPRNGLRLVHIDAYRMSGVEELDTIGWDELLESTDAVMAIEWSDRIAGALPQSHLRVELHHVGDRERIVQFNVPDSMQSIAELLEKSVGLGQDKTARDEHACPICGRGVAGDSPTFPFCSPRCRLADLGRWFTGFYKVTRPLQPDDHEDV